MEQRVHDIEWAMAEAQNNLRQPVDLGVGGAYELREAVVDLTDDRDRLLGYQALFALQPEMVQVPVQPIEPVPVQPALFEYRTRKIEEDTNV